MTGLFQEKRIAKILVIEIISDPDPVTPRMMFSEKSLDLIYS